MFDKIIAYSIENKFVIGLCVLALIVWGIFSLRQLPIDAVPDITDNQVQIITTAPTLATQEVEQFITTPVELAMQNLQQLVEIRSISRFGLSVVTVVFEEKMNLYLARQLVGEALKDAQENIPTELGIPKMAPVSTGLGEVYQYVLEVDETHKDQYSLMDLRTMQDWIVRRQLSGIEGVVDVNTFGGLLKQYEVAVAPNQLKAMNISIRDVFEALQNSNENTGGAYIEKNPSTYYIRTTGIIQSTTDIENIVIEVRNSKPIHIKDVAKVQFGDAPRYGALVRNGEEAVGGRVMMLKGANSGAVVELVKERVVQVQKSLPDGVRIHPYLVRDKLINNAIHTVEKNLLEGGLIVIFILVLMLGNFRAGLIVASVIPLAMLFAVSMMNVLGISANLMSLGAIDFGLIVDGAVIIVEAIIHRLQVKFAGQQMTATQMNNEVKSAAIKIRSSAAFGEIIILMVYIPILALVGIEGKMFKPMAQTVMLAIGGALILSLTYVPMMAALFLNKKISDKKTIADRIILFTQKLYTPVLNIALRFKTAFILLTIGLFVFTMIVFGRMGGEFIPTLEEGDLAMQQVLPPGTSLAQSVEVASIIHKKLLADFPEIEEIVTNLGSAEIPTDPMAVETGDYTLVMKPHSEWTSAHNRVEMFEKLDEALSSIPGVGLDFTQPIQLRFNELMTGSKADIAIKLYGNDLDLLFKKAKEAEKVITDIEGIGSINVEQTTGMPQIIVRFDYDKMAQYGLQVKEVNQVIRAAFAGETAGIIYEGDRRFDLVVRYDKSYRKDISSVHQLYIPLKNGSQVPLSAVAEVKLEDAPMQISRENANRSIVIGVNVGDTDVETLVSKIQEELDTKLDLPTGYYFTYGGQFENLKAAQERLSIALPIALGLIFILLYFTFSSLPQALLIFTAIPLSAIGGVWALQLRGMPFSISAGIGFIALFGVAVLNGIVLIGYFNQLKQEGMTNIRERIIEGTKVRLRPVLMTASVASLGFLPMALSTSGGAEVQRPLATVVIGGLITATFLTLVVLPILYSWLANWQERNSKISIPKSTIIVLFLLSLGGIVQAQQRSISIEEATQLAKKNHPSIQSANLQIQQGQALQDLKYNLGNTSINYQGDALFRQNGQRVNQVRVVQNIPNPSTVKAQNALQDEQVLQFRLDKQLTEKELELDVQQLYLDIQQRKALKKVYQNLIKLYETYYLIAQKRVKIGEANRMEELTLQSAINEQQLLLRQSNLEIQNLEKQFSNLLNTTEILTTIDTFLVMSFEVIDTINAVQLQLQMQQIQIEQANIDVLIAQMKPDFNVGYAAQNYFDGGWLSGLEVGVQIPLFNQQIRQKITAQEMQVAVTKSIVETKRQRIEQNLLALENTIQLYETGINFYKEQQNSILPEMERISKLNYQAGEISYLELLNAIQLFANNQKSYWEQVSAHNQAVVLYQFLSNQ